MMKTLFHAPILKALPAAYVRKNPTVPSRDARLTEGIVAARKLKLGEGVLIGTFKNLNSATASAAYARKFLAKAGAPLEVVVGSLRGGKGGVWLTPRANVQLAA